MTTFTVHEAKTQLSRLIAAAEAGEEVVITRGRTPVARLTAITVAGPGGRTPGRLKGQLVLADDFDAPMSEAELRLWEGADD